MTLHTRVFRIIKEEEEGKNRNGDKKRKRTNSREDQSPQGRQRKRSLRGKEEDGRQGRWRLVLQRKQASSFLLKRVGVVGAEIRRAKLINRN